MNWIYNNKQYTSIPFKNDEDAIDYFKKDNNMIVYHKKWDKVYILCMLNYCGNGNNLKAYIEDIYTKKGCYTEARNLERIEEIIK